VAVPHALLDRPQAAADREVRRLACDDVEGCRDGRVVVRARVVVGELEDGLEGLCWKLEELAVGVGRLEIGLGGLSD